MIERTDLDWKKAAYVVGNVLQCWEYRSTIDAILEHESFATESTRTAVEIVDSTTDRSRHAETEYRKQLSVYYPSWTSGSPIAR